MASQVLTDGNDSASATAENVYALDGDDYFYVGASAVTGTYNVYGGEGLDFIQMSRNDSFAYFYGGGGADTLSGGQLDDHLYGNDGGDLLIGGEIDNGAFGSGVIQIYLNEPTGNDLLMGDDGRDALYGFDGNDTLYGGDDDDSGTIIAYNSSHSPNIIAGGLFGGAGDDYLDGGRGNDYLDGGIGNDTMLGGIGNDTYVVYDVGDQVLEAPGAGLDIVNTDLNKYILPENCEGIQLIGTQNLTTYGRGTNDYIYGNVGNNTLFGDAGNDLLDGGAGNDTYSGGGGNDLLRDTAGGNDTFVFNGAWGNDTIQGFQAGPAVGDVIAFDKNDFANINAVVAAWADVGGNTVITHGSDTVTILGVTTAQLASNDFLFF